MAKSKEKRDEQISVRLPSVLLDKIKREAEQDRRTIADIVIFALEDRYASKRTKGSK